MPRIATADVVQLPELLEFLRPRHHALLSTVRADGRPQISPVTCGVDGLVDYYRCIAGEHPDWDEYRAAMVRQDKSLIRVTIERWGPIATGGFPPEHS